VFGVADGLFRQFAGPIDTNAISLLRLAAGFNDVGRARQLTAIMNRFASDPTEWLNQQGLLDRIRAVAAGGGYAPVKMGVEQAIRAFNNYPWPRFDGDDESQKAFWLRLQSNLRTNGVDMALPWGVQPAVLAGTGTTEDRTEWLRLINMSSTAASLDQVLVDYYRSQPLDGNDKVVDEDELNFNLQRGQYRRRQDRERLLKPFFKWSNSDAYRAFRMGLLEPDNYTALLRAGGLVQPDDANLWTFLSQFVPDGEVLFGYTSRRLWDGDFANKWGLDRGSELWPVGKFFAGIQGLGGGQVRLPNQPDGESDWGKLAYRAARPVVDHQTARELQFRLRPDPNADGDSVIPGVPAWMPQDTIEHLQRQGWSDEYIERLMAVVPEPLNVRIINEVLTEALKHPAVAAQAQADFGEGVDWVQGAFLDHGFTEPVAALAASALRAKADDEANAERLESEKQLRAEHRAAVIESYKLGLINRVQAIAQLQGRFFTEAMAGDAIQLIDESFTATFTAGAVNEIEKAFLAGKINIGQVGAQFAALGIIPDRQANYVQRWVWAKNDDVRMASTGEIIAAAKAGLITGPTALTRLVNLGWTSPDAMLELAMAQHELAQAAIHTQASEAAKQIAAQQRAEAKVEAEAKAKAKVEAAAAKAAKAAAAKAAGVPLESTIDQEKYSEAAEKALDAYNKAKAKGDDAKAQSEIDAAAAAYKEMLLHDLRLRQESPEVAKSVKAAPEIPVPSPPASKGAG
jgi:hypothetical protein